MQGQNFPIHHDIDGILQVELDTLRSLPLSQRMLNVRPVVKPLQIADQAQASNRTPPDIFHETIGDLGFGGNHHRAAGELAVVESHKKTAPAIEFWFAFDAEREWTTVKSCECEKN